MARKGVLLASYIAELWFLSINVTQTGNIFNKNFVNNKQVHIRLGKWISYPKYILFQHQRI